MRIEVDIPEALIERLDTLCARQSRSRVAVIQAAIADYLARRDAVFGVWGTGTDEGLTTQRRLRAEWAG